MSSDTQGAEKRSFTVVNMPCFVQSKEAATSMLGGTGVLSDAINNKHSLVSNLATECPVNGQRRNFAGVVMRIKRKKKTKEVTSSDILGNVTSAYDFCQQADMKVKDKYCTYFCDFSNHGFVIIDDKVISRIFTIQLVAGAVFDPFYYIINMLYYLLGYGGCSIAFLWCQVHAY